MAVIPLFFTYYPEKKGGPGMVAYGYVRVSSTDQNEDRQMIALRQVGVENKHIFMDKQSGKDFDRPQYKKWLKRCGRAIFSMCPA